MPRAQRTLLSYHGRERLRRKKRRKRTNEEAETRSALSPFLLSSRGQAKSGATFFIFLIFPFFFISLSRPPSLCVAGHRLRGSSHFCCSSRRSCPRRHASPTRSLRRWYVREERRGRERGREDIVRGVHFCEGRARGFAPCAFKNLKTKTTPPPKTNKQTPNQNKNSRQRGPLLTSSPRPLRRARSRPGISLPRSPTGETRTEPEPPSLPEAAPAGRGRGRARPSATTARRGPPPRPLPPPRTAPRLETVPRLETARLRRPATRL